MQSVYPLVYGPEMVRQVILLHNKLYCSFERPLSWQWEGSPGWCSARSTALVCPFTLQVWCVSKIDRTPEEFQILHHSDTRPTRYGTPGALNIFQFDQPIDPALTDFAPIHLIVRELQKEYLSCLPHP